MNTLVIIFIYWVLAAVFGNDFIQFSVMGINTFYILMGLSIMYWGLRLKSTKNVFDTSKESKELYSSIKFFSAFSLLYLFLSYFHFFTGIFNVDVDYNISYVLRQGYLVFTIPIIFTIVNSIVQRPNYWVPKITNRRKLIFIWGILVVAKSIIGVDLTPYRSLIFALGSMIFILAPKKKISLVIIIYSSLCLINLFNSSSSFLAWIIAFVIFLLWDIIIAISQKNISLKIWISFIIVLLVFLFATDFVVSIFANDANSVWRWQYWMNEIKVVINTWGVGIGYGTAYASNSIYEEINNASVFVSQTSSEGSGLFVITQHSSFINFFYRLGVAGFVLAVQMWIVKPMKLFTSSIKSENDINNTLVKWGVINFMFNSIIILLNPGLESPRFALGYIITFSLMVAFCILSSQQKYKKLEQEI